MERMFDIEKTINDIKEYAELLDKYRALEEEYKKLEERVKFLEEENSNLKNNIMEDMKYELELEGKIRFLEHGKPVVSSGPCL